MIKSLSGPQRTAVGYGRIVDQDSNSKLKVKFFWLAPEGDYWIIKLDSHYRWAVVGDPTRKSLWILSRQRHMSFQLYKKILSSLEKEHAYDTKKLVFAAQPAVLDGKAGIDSNCLSGDG